VDVSWCGRIIIRPLQKPLHLTCEEAVWPWQAHDGKNVRGAGLAPSWVRGMVGTGLVIELNHGLCSIAERKKR
jgi:hypothetical protein